MKAETRVTSKGQVVIPKLVRERLRWVPGTQLAVEEVGDGTVRLAPLRTADPIDSLYGCLKAHSRDSLAEIELGDQVRQLALDTKVNEGRPMSTGAVAVVDS